MCVCIIIKLWCKEFYILITTIVIVSTLATKKLESVKVEIEQLCGYELLNVDVHQQLQECVKLCDSAKKMLTEEHQELKAKHEELLKEKEELTTQLELLKQTN